MYKIGEFSVLSKTTIKTLRYYEKEGLLKPSFVGENGYRYYETNKLIDLSKIISLRQIGFSILQIVGFPRERYIDGVWNKENIADWLTEIQVPVEMKK